MNNLLFLVPCFNEEHRFPLDYWRKLIDNKNFNFLFINDGSTDKTLEILTSIKSDNTKLVRLPKNVGKSNALRYGLLKAYEDSNKYVLIIDSDASFSIECIFDFIARVEYEEISNSISYQAFFAARVKLAGRFVNRIFSRHIYSRVFHTILGFTNRELPYDTNCGMKILNLENIPSSIFLAPFKSRWFFEIEMIRRHKSLNNSSIKIFDVPILDCVDQPTHNFNLKNRIFIVKELLWLLR
jgi:dolichyl-phosphate beta-glucosyltransferase